uniref:Membrane glycoprotein lig-1 n=1 Tax=Daphnia galeata TaxID=27404 RepID=A0A8J2RM78_9CRUS|nr:unnamed protein product [Daphnia galeata]
MTTTVLANPTTRTVCPEDYSPCACDLTGNGLEITCIDVTIPDIVDVFFRTQNLFLYSVSLTIISATGSIDLPADLLSDKRAQNIYLNCPAAASPKLSVTIDAASFEFTRFNTTRFEIHDCDLIRQKDMKFLSGFLVLNSFYFANTFNVEAIAGLANNTLPALKELTVVNCTGLENVVFPDLTPARLELLRLDGNGLTDAGVNHILVAVASSSSASSLKLLSLSNNAMTKIPMIASFSPTGHLRTLQQHRPLHEPIDFDLQLSGNYRYAQVNLENNRLTEFKEDIFKSMLQQMTIQSPAIGGHVLVTGNPFDCGCGLAWLIRDNQVLLPSVKNGVCGGFFRFEDLNPDAYGNC